jgi:CRISPR-associated endonuclease/helicase Cas3
MADCVIIFDEVQSIPVKCIHLFNSTMNFLNKVCNSTILLCTATQPLLDDKAVTHKILLSENSPIALHDEVPKRTNIVDALRPVGFSYPELAEFVLNQHNMSTLVIVNTKAAAKALHTELNAVEVDALHMSTNMCPAHRDGVFKELRNRLDAKEKIICVSTQLIEAGVDISFECVIRDIAGLDSILQAAGRCNRHGEFEEVKNVYVVNVREVNLSKLPDIQKGAEITRRLFDDGNLCIDTYYRHYFHARRNIMDYPTGGGSIYDMLTKNAQGSEAYQNRGNTQKVELRAAIRSAADSFYVIAPGQTDVVVPFEGAMTFLEEYETCVDLIEKRKIMQNLGRYSVSLYGFQLEDLRKRGALSVNGGIYVLSSGFYDSNLGIDFDGSHEFLCV